VKRTFPGDATEGSAELQRRSRAVTMTTAPECSTIRANLTRALLNYA
jgi:hypothetical protein